MTNKFTIGSITNCGTGFSAPADAKFDLNVGTFDRCQKAIELRDPPSLMESIGLPRDISPPLLRDLLCQLQNPGLTRVEISSCVEQSRLRRDLGAGADISTIITGFMTLYQSNLVPAALAMLSTYIIG